MESLAARTLPRAPHAGTLIDVRWVAMAALLATPACLTDRTLAELADGGASEGGTTTTGVATTTSSADDSTTTTSPPTWSPDFGEPPSYPTCDGFVCPHDLGVHDECDVWAQDCAAGLKCMPCANDGGNSWNSTCCTPIDPTPAAIGGPCTVEGSGVSGIDDCPIASMCWNVDPETSSGTCVAFCQGTEANPLCEDPSTSCSINGEETLILCLHVCDPLAQDCGEWQGCYALNDLFFCVPDAGGDGGGLGDECDFLNECDPGLFCADADRVTGCSGSANCCSQFCDITSADPDAQCSLAGQVCVPWYELGMAPPGLTHVGACALPS
jgi:hypothetical protein